MKFGYFCLLSFKNITFHFLFQYNMYGRLSLFRLAGQAWSCTGKLKMAGDKKKTFLWKGTDKYIILQT